MPEQPVNPFETWGGMPKITPQNEGPPEQLPFGAFGGLGQGEGGSHFELSPEAMQMMWAPPPQVQAQTGPPPPQINPLI